MQGTHGNREQEVAGTQNTDSEVVGTLAENYITHTEPLHGKTVYIGNTDSTQKHRSIAHAGNTNTCSEAQSK